MKVVTKKDYSVILVIGDSDKISFDNGCLVTKNVVATFCRDAVNVFTGVNNVPEDQYMKKYFFNGSVWMIDPNRNV